MPYLNINRDIYERMLRLLPDMKPQVRLELVAADDALVQLGFCKSAPCKVRLDLPQDEYAQLMDDLMQLEIDAYQTPDGNEPASDDPAYQKYVRYGWMWDYLHSATER